MIKSHETSVKIKFKVPSLSGKDENNVDLNLDIMEASSASTGTELKRKRRQKKRRKGASQPRAGAALLLDQDNDEDGSADLSTRTAATDSELAGDGSLTVAEVLAEPELSAAKQNSAAKKDKGPIKIQDMPTYISDLKGFVRSMKDIRLKGWRSQPTSLPTIGSSIELPIWTK